MTKDFSDMRKIVFEMSEALYDSICATLTNYENGVMDTDASDLYASLVEVQRSALL